MVKNVCVISHVLPWELKTAKRGLQRFSDNYYPRKDINLHLNLILNLSDFHTDWSQNKVKQIEIINEIYIFMKTLKFTRSYITILDSNESSGHIDTFKHIKSNYYNGYIWYCTDTYYHKRYLENLLNLIANTNHTYTWIAPEPNTERIKKLTKEDIDNSQLGVGFANPGQYCMGFFWFDYISNSLLDLVGWPPFECYGPQDSYTGFIMTEIYKAIPKLNYGHYYLLGDIISPCFIEDEDIEYKKNFIIKQNKESQRANTEKDFFNNINNRIREILTYEIIHPSV